MNVKTEGQTSTESKKGDQRKKLRAPLLVLRARLDEGGKVFFGYAKNISRSGLFIATANPRLPGSQFKLELSLPAPLAQTVQCTCEVIWKREFSTRSHYEPGMGLKFLDMPEETADQIDEWVKAQNEPG